MSFTSKLTAARGNGIFLVSSPFPDGRHAWYFVRVPLPKFNAFRKAVTSGPTNLTQYGEILKKGWGKTPPESVISEMKEMGYNGDTG